MAKFRNYNLIDIVEHLKFQIQPGEERAYLEMLPRGVIQELIVNYAELASSKFLKYKPPVTQDPTGAIWVKIDVSPSSNQS